MQVAALYDIHGNLFALQAALRDVRAAGVDLIVVGGDVLPGPMPGETLACLLALEKPVRFIHGNGDRLVATHLAGGDIGEVPEAFREMIHWTAQQLDDDGRRAIASCTHMQFDRMVSRRRVVNAGSIGMPYQSPPGAYWLLLGPDVRLQRSDYDFERAAEAIRATAFPQVEALMVRYIVNPPAEQESLQMLAGAELT